LAIIGLIRREPTMKKINRAIFICIIITLPMMVVLSLSSCGSPTGGNNQFSVDTVVFVAPPVLPQAKVDSAYEHCFCQPNPAIQMNLCGGIVQTTNPIGGNPPYTFTLGSGVGFPPFGIILNLNGCLTGTPTAPGTSTFEVVAKDLSGNQDSRLVSLTVTPLDSFNVTVTKAGTGSGNVSSTPTGINCGTACNWKYVEKTTVTLTATPDAGSTFEGWSGDCAGTSVCTLLVDTAKTVTATFDTIPLEPPVDSTEVTITISSETCEAVRFDFGGLMYNDVSVSGSASGPVGTRLTLPAVGIPSETPQEHSCGDWGDNCERDTDEPPTTNWAVRGSATAGQYVSSVSADTVSTDVILDCPSQ
jgi:hypothetical protein